MGRQCFLYLQQWSNHPCGTRMIIIQEKKSICIKSSSVDILNLFQLCKSEYSETYQRQPAMGNKQCFLYLQLVSWCFEPTYPQRINYIRADIYLQQWSNRQCGTRIIIWNNEATTINEPVPLHVTMKQPPLKNQYDFLKQWSNHNLEPVQLHVTMKLPPLKNQSDYM